MLKELLLTLMTFMIINDHCGKSSLFTGKDKEFEYDCKLEYKYSKRCYFYDFQNNCFPWTLEHCEPVHVKKNEAKCPKYTCIKKVRNK